MISVVYPAPHHWGVSDIVFSPVIWSCPTLALCRCGLAVLKLYFQTGLQWVTMVRRHNFSLYEQTQSWLTYFFFLLITHCAQDTLTTVRDPDHTNNQIAVLFPYVLGKLLNSNYNLLSLRQFIASSGLMVVLEVLRKSTDYITFTEKRATSQYSMSLSSSRYVQFCLQGGFKRPD